MAKLLERDQGHKISIVVSQTTYLLYKKNLKKARAMGFRVEFRADMERFFLAEQRKVADEILKLENYDGGSDLESDDDV